MKIFYLLLLLPAFFAQSAYSEIRIDSNALDSVAVDIIVTKSGSKTLFKADLPPLQGQVGGRQPFYSYLWDFGDGHFSLKESPEHNYAELGEYTVNLYVVNNYDDGPRPKRRAKQLVVDTANVAGISISQDEERFFGSNGIFQISKNANAVPGEDMTLIVGVKNPGKGKVILLTNEKIYGEDGLQYAGQSTYNNEQIVPGTSLTNLNELWASIHQATVTLSGSPDYGIKEEHLFQPEEAVAYFSKLYDSYKTISSYEIESATEAAQFSFVNLDVTPEMLADTNAIVTITGIYVPEKGDAVIHKLEVPVVTSHDPNKMSIKQSRLNYRTLSKNKELIYKVQFQNDGEGDAKNVRLEIALPEQVDPTTFRLLNLYPYCEPCITAEEKGCWNQYIKGNDTLVFHFKDISLPGTKAEDVADQDSTKGFIRFSVQTKKKLENKAFKAQTNIYFDKNDPIKTNVATGRFRKGFSPILFAGYSAFLSKPKFKEGTFNEMGMLGIGLAPLAPYRKFYWQVEVYASPSSYKEINNIDEKGTVLVDIVDGEGNLRPTDVYYNHYDKEVRSNDLNIRVVPLHIRYNFNSFLSAGIGGYMEFSVNLDSKEERVYFPAEQQLFEPIRKDLGNWYGFQKQMRIKTFVDLTVGRVYLGPSLGLRYNYGGNHGQQMNLYAAWRF